MTRYNLGLVKELVNAFNVSNYGSKVNTNFVVEGNNIVVKFNCDQHSAKRYLSQMARGLVREYFSGESVASNVFDLESLPFNFDKGEWTYSKAGTQLTVPIDSGIIFNLKVHFAEEFMSDVETQMINEIHGDPACNLSKKDIEKILNENIKQAKANSSFYYIQYLLFDDLGIQTHFEQVLQAKMEKHGCSCSDFCHVNGNEVSVKDVKNIDFIRDVTEASKKEVGYNFYLQHSDNLKVKARHYKDAMGELIFRLAGVSICGYYRDNFISKDRISKGDNFAFIPMIKEGNISRYLNRDEANRINAQFGYDLLTDIKGQTENTRSGRFGGVYAFSDRQIALLIPVIIGNSVINKDGQIEIDPELHFRALSPAQSPLNSPTHAGPSGLRTPPNKRKADTDSGYDSNSPPKPKDSGSSSGGPGPSTELSYMEWESPTRSHQEGKVKESPRQGFMEVSDGLLSSKQVDVPEPSRRSVNAAYVPARTSACTQPITNRWPSQGTSGWTQSSSRPLSSLPPPPPLIPISGSVSGSQPPVSFTSTLGPGWLCCIAPYTGSNLR